MRHIKAKQKRLCLKQNLFTLNIIVVIEQTIYRTIVIDQRNCFSKEAAYFKQKGICEDVVVVAPDHNSVKGARNLADLLKAPIAIVDKRDDTRLDIENSSIIGERALRSARA